MRLADRERFSNENLNDLQPRRCCFVTRRHSKDHSTKFKNAGSQNHCMSERRLIEKSLNGKGNNKIHCYINTNNVESNKYIQFL